MNRWLAALLLSACAATPREPLPAAADVPAVALAPQVAPRYGDPSPTPCPKSELHERLFALIARRAGETHRDAPRPDGRLCRAAEALGQVMLDGRPPPQAAVEFALSQVGIVEPVPNLLVLVGDPRDLGGLTAAFDKQLAQLPTTSSRPHVGLGVVPRDDGRAVVALILQDSFIELAPIEREIARGRTVSLSGKLLPPYKSPSLFLTLPDGSTQKLLAHGSGASFEVPWRCDGLPGRYQLEVMGDGGVGPAVLANFPVYCGSAAPLSLAVTNVDRSPVTDPRDAEQRIFELANQARVQAGLPKLLWHEGAARVARKHSTEMRDSHFLAHTSPTTGDVRDRLRAAAVKTPVALENLARAYSPGDVHQGLMNSPGHRQNILSDKPTHLGVGVALDTNDGPLPALYVTQVFVRELATVDVAATREAVRRALLDKRKRGGKRVASTDAELDAVAETIARSLLKAHGQLPRDRQQQLLAAAPSRYAQVGALIAVSGEPRELAENPSALDAADALGVGVVQGDHPELGPNALYVVVLFATRR